jgi:hypothetical protein
VGQKQKQFAKTFPFSAAKKFLTVVHRKMSD